LVYLALSAEEHEQTKTLNWPPSATRLEIRQRTVSEALNMVRLYLLSLLAKAQKERSSV